MDDPHKEYRLAVSRLADGWLADGLPSHAQLYVAADELDRLRRRLGIDGLWATAPTMVTATLDDALGQGLAIIERFSRSIGIRLYALGLMPSPDAIVRTCRRYRPTFLGLTVLQFDSEDDLSVIARQLPARTRIVAGGPVFAGDPDFARRTGVHFAAKNVAALLKFMVDSPGIDQALADPLADD